MNKLNSSVKNLFGKYGFMASILQVGGFKPSAGYKESYFGEIKASYKGEFWPTDKNGTTMTPLCQINLEELDCEGTGKDDTKFITIFMSADPSQMGEKNGDGWLLRSYSDLSKLVELKNPIRSDIKAFPIRKSESIIDWPSYDDANVEIPEDLEDNYDSNYPNNDGFKFGGWPTLLQGCLTVKGEFIFQIPSLPKANWSWGDGGIAYFIKRDECWRMEWQCY